MARRGRTSNLRRGAKKARRKVSRARGGKLCGHAPNGTLVCISTKKISGMHCGKNHINGLYACACVAGRYARAA